MKPPLAVGDAVELRIEKPVYRGLGLARHEGCVVFVPGTYAGERVAARVLEQGRGYARAEALQVLEPSAARRQPPCAHAEACGGCSYQPLAYAEQLLVKETILRESLARAHVSFVGALPVRPSPESGWRLRAELHVDWSNAASPRLGFHRAGTHEVVDVQSCEQLSGAMNAAARALRAALVQRRPLSERVRSVELAESIDGGQLVACLAAQLDVPGLAGLAALGAELPGLHGLLARATEEPGSGPLLLRGEAFLEQTLFGLPLRAHQQSFFQSNRFLIEPLVRTVLERVGSAGPVLDLYAGVGLFALPLAARGEDVVAVEANVLAAEDARANARQAGLRNLRVEASDVESCLRRLPPRAGERIVLDPPRDGLSRLALRAIAARQPATITYVSCDPPTLGRDLNLLARSGYSLLSLDAFDMFPDTFHVECIAHLARSAAL